MAAGAKFPSQSQYALCRCGQSANKPFCDGTHTKVGFDGTETASRKAYRDQAKVMRGPAMSLTDVESLCAFARFCDPNGQVWNLVNETGRPEDAQGFRAADLRLSFRAACGLGQRDRRTS